jgi:hypothetical protein
MTGAGYSRCFNVAGGFEGMRDDAGTPRNNRRLEGGKPAVAPVLIA